MEFNILLLVLVVAIIFFAASLKIAGESERFAIFMLGRFVSIQGPGLVLIVPFTQRAHRLKIGDVGVLVNAEFARFDDVEIPVRDTGSFRQGQAVAIDGFDGVEIRLKASSARAKTTCPSCGHTF